MPRVFFCQPAGSSLSPSATKCICSRTSQNLSRFANQTPGVYTTMDTRSAGQKLKQTRWQCQTEVLLSFPPFFDVFPSCVDVDSLPTNSQCPQNGCIQSNMPTNHVTEVWRGSWGGAVPESSRYLFERMETHRTGFCSCSGYVSFSQISRKSRGRHPTSVPLTMCEGNRMPRETEIPSP